uniref:DRBM domain-containing protein n=1 Tax=Sus scrofa TaxID=9823 RepID=A0A8D1WDV7_PIG
MASGRSPCFYIEELNKYQQKNDVILKYRELCKTGPAHNLRFTYQVVIDEKEFPKAEGRSKKEAKNAAAKLAFEIINKEHKANSSSSLPTANPPDRQLTENYIGRINTISQKKNLSVNYEPCEPGEDGPEKFHYKCKIGRKVYGSGVGSTKQEAKQLAAKQAYEKLQSENFMNADPPSSSCLSTASSDIQSSSPTTSTSASESATENGFSANTSESSDNSDRLNNSVLSPVVQYLSLSFLINLISFVSSFKNDLRYPTIIFLPFSHVFPLSLFFFFFFFFVFSRVTLEAYGGSQARGLIRAVAEGFARATATPDASCL